MSKWKVHYIKREGVSLESTVGIEYCIIALFADFHPRPPSASLDLLAILLEGWIAIDEEF
jgi:hypothetical protein